MHQPLLGTAVDAVDALNEQQGCDVCGTPSTAQQGKPSQISTTLAARTDAKGEKTACTYDAPCRSNSLILEHANLTIATAELVCLQHYWHVSL